MPAIRVIVGIFAAGASIAGHAVFPASTVLPAKAEPHEGRKGAHQAPRLGVPSYVGATGGARPF